MKYLILIQSNPRSLAAWDAMSDDERMAFGRDHLNLSGEMAEAGVLVASEGLADPGLATWVSVREGRTIPSDGPYAEVKEHLAGFYLIEARDLNDAIQIAAKIPPAREGSIEVRPIRELDPF